MKKPCREEKPVLKKEPVRFSLFIIFILFYQEVYPQVPINGFCRYNYFKADTGYTNFLLVNYNNDAYSDFILFNPAKKDILTLDGSNKGDFKKQKKYSLANEFTFIKPFSSRPSSPYIFTNRIKRKVGLIEFNDKGKPIFGKLLNFDSYPENISIADIDNDYKNEVLISGGAFNGISLIYRDSKKIIEKNILKGTSFSQAAFIDLNNDGYEDIAGYNLFNLSFDFYYNNSLGEFRKVRSVNFLDKIINLHPFDINLDSYEDLIFSSGMSIYIWYGDFRASYENTKKITTNYKPDKFIYGDFNKDGLIDFAYLNREHSLVSVIFAKNEFDYYSEIIYLQQSGLTDISPYHSRFINGIAALSIYGSLHTITNLSSFADVVNISVGAKPDAITFFDNKNNGITDLCFIDNYDKKLKFITRNNAGIPEFFYSFQLNENHGKIISENLDPGEKNYICFSYGKKLIEIVRIDFPGSRSNKTVLYSPGAIFDLKPVRSNNGDFKIYILFLSNGSLNFGAFSYVDGKFILSKQLIENIKPYDASLSPDKEITINYWVKKENKISLFTENLNTPNEIAEEKISISEADSLKIILFTGDLLNMDKEISFSFIRNDNNDYAIIDAGKFITDTKNKDMQGGFRITSKNNLFFGETRFNGLKKLCVYLQDKKVVNRLEIIRKGKTIASTKLADALYAGSFFIKNMTSKNYHIVYTDMENSCITIRKLKG